MEIFTDIEKHILEVTDKNFKWIARDKGGELVIYEAKPFRNEVDGIFDTEVDKIDIFDKCFSDVLFKNVTWENSPIQYRDDELLTPKEKEYLKFVFRPFASDTLYIQKAESSVSMEYIRAVTTYSSTYLSTIVFPDFKKGTMYKGMKPNTKYTLKELGIEYNE
jgi:hypothetical protein